MQKSESNRMQHLKADADCSYLLQRKCGNAIMQLEINYKSKTIR